MFLPQPFYGAVLMSETFSLYIHIPFCKSKCPYCDFYSMTSNEREYDKYTDILIQKIKYWGNQTNKIVSTVYFGGGTPSVLGAERFCKIYNEIKNNFHFCKSVETTVEINPDTGKSIDFKMLRQCGINRISIGLQSAVDKEINILGRIHTPNDAKFTVERAKSAGIENISLDLMMGIPYQTEKSLKKSIDFCNECGVTHISSYILKVEKNTAFYKYKNQLFLPDEDKQADLYLYAVNYLDKLGFKQYEISNFAKKGFESKHNNNYWKCNEYIGIGPSAHSFFKGKRFYYGRSMNDFENNIIIDDGSGGDEEEFIMLSLRLSNGLNLNEFEKKFNRPLPYGFINKANLYAKNGFMNICIDSISFTPKGFLVSNAIISDLLNYI